MASTDEITFAQHSVVQ